MKTEVTSRPLKKIKISSLRTRRRKQKAIRLWGKTKGNISAICRVIGVSRKVYYDWLRKDKAFLQAIEEEEGKLNDKIRGLLVKD